MITTNMSTRGHEPCAVIRMRKTRKHSKEKGKGGKKKRRNQGLWLWQHFVAMPSITSLAFPLPPILPSSCSHPSRVSSYFAKLGEGEGEKQAAPRARPPRSTFGNLQNKASDLNYGTHWCCSQGNTKRRKYEGREIRTPNLLIWSQTRCRCAIPP